MSRKVTAQVQNRKLVAERRDLIIGAAAKVFRQKGFHVSTTHDVASVAGITQSNLYNYVRSKHDILYLVCEHLMGLYHDAVEEASSRFTDPHARLVESMRAVISVMCSHKQELVLLYNETHSLKKRDRRLIMVAVSNLIKRFQDLVVDYEATHGPTRISNKRLAANLLSFVPAVVALRSWDLAMHVDQAEMEASILDYSLAGLGIPVPPRNATRRPEARAAKLRKKEFAQRAAEPVASERESRSARRTKEESDDQSLAPN